jgi:ribonuclease P protein component
MSRPFSLPKQARISGNNQFSCLLSLRPVGKSTFFKLYYRPYTNLTKSKSIPKFGQISFGVLIPKAQVAQSHHRNYLKRLVREYVRQKHPVLCSGQYLVRWVLPKKELEKNQSSPKVLSVPIHQALHSIFKPSLLKDLPDSFPHPQGS